jgi:hypothetical protein
MWVCVHKKLKLMFRHGTSARRESLPALALAFMFTLAYLMHTTSAYANPQTIAKSRPQTLPDVLSSAAIHTTQPINMVRHEGDLNLLKVSGASTLNAEDSRDPRGDTRDLKNAPNACTAQTSTVCYDYKNRRTMVPMTKNVMLPVPGLTREGITLKRDKAVFVYSF